MSSSKQAGRRLFNAKAHFCKSDLMANKMQWLYKYIYCLDAHAADPENMGEHIRRWDGLGRTTEPWDGLRRDPDLWYADGDCLVYLHSHGGSQRGPSFRLLYDIIRASNSVALLNRYSTQTYLEEPWYADRSPDGDESHDGPTAPVYHEIYIPAPAHATRAEAFEYHMDTRNFFAWMFCKPIVGRDLGTSLVSLWQRLALFRSADDGNGRDLMDYVEEQGYADFRECPDHALGVLFLAEELHMQDLWTDAFVHCVGMNARLVSSTGFEIISRTTKALITRAKLEMDIRIDQAERQLTTFLDDELSGAHLGLGEGARAHLERFRSFLHAFYVAKFGYWPPPPPQHERAALAKATYFSMYFDFRSLYEHLVDAQSSSVIEHHRPADGGLCVRQNVASFDQRHRYAALPHPLPLLPDTGGTPRRPHSLDTRRLGHSLSKSARSERHAATLAALSAATNAPGAAGIRCPLVRAYMGFERDCTLKPEERVSVADARKVRWILIYAVLQTLVSVTRAPREVRQTEDVSYHLSCETAGTPPWTIAGTSPAARSRPGSPPLRDGASTAASDPAGRLSIEIQPDARYPPHRPPPPETPHRRSGLSPRTWTSPATVALPAGASRRSSSAFCEIIVPGYGNGMTAAGIPASTPLTRSRPDHGADHNHDHRNNDEGRWSGVPSASSSTDERETTASTGSSSFSAMATATTTALPSMDHVSVSAADDDPVEQSIKAESPDQSAYPGLGSFSKSWPTNRPVEGSKDADRGELRKAGSVAILSGATVTAQKGWSVSGNQMAASS
ncbi:MAG: hypothetical protein M1826_001928 [Phylliscum demangeonii]|nr:MAG: hypothetical protein M1826_001928 [Phylliscum demangeonii]